MLLATGLAMQNEKLNKNNSGSFKVSVAFGHRQQHLNLNHKFAWLLTADKKKF